VYPDDRGFSTRWLRLDHWLLLLLVQVPRLVLLLGYNILKLQQRRSQVVQQSFVKAAGYDFDQHAKMLELRGGQVLLRDRVENGLDTVVQDLPR